MLSCSEDSNQPLPEFNALDSVSITYTTKYCNSGDCFLFFELNNTSTHWINMNVRYIFNRQDSKYTSNQVVKIETTTGEGSSQIQIPVDPETEIVSYEIIDAVDMGDTEN